MSSNDKCDSRAVVHSPGYMLESLGGLLQNISAESSIKSEYLRQWGGTPRIILSRQSQMILMYIKIQKSLIQSLGERSELQTEMCHLPLVGDCLSEF